MINRLISTPWARLALGMALGFSAQTALSAQTVSRAEATTASRQARIAALDQSVEDQPGLAEMQSKALSSLYETKGDLDALLTYPPDEMMTLQQLYFLHDVMQDICEKNEVDACDPKNVITEHPERQAIVERLLDAAEDMDESMAALTLVPGDALMSQMARQIVDQNYDDVRNIDQLDTKATSLGLVNLYVDTAYNFEKYRYQISQFRHSNIETLHLLDSTGPKHKFVQITDDAVPAARVPRSVHLQSLADDAMVRAADHAVTTLEQVSIKDLDLDQATSLVRLLRVLCFDNKQPTCRNIAAKVKAEQHEIINAGGSTANDDVILAPLDATKALFAEMISLINQTRDDDTNLFVRMGNDGLLSLNLTKRLDKNCERFSRFSYDIINITTPEPPEIESPLDNKPAEMPAPNASEPAIPSAEPPSPPVDFPQAALRSFPIPHQANLSGAVA